MLSSAAALLAERRVLARRGWVGEKSGLFEHPAGDAFYYREGLAAVVCRVGETGCKSLGPGARETIAGTLISKLVSPPSSYRSFPTL